MKPLLLTTAAMEAGAGLALLGLPSRFAQLLFAAPLEGAVALTARGGECALFIDIIGCPRTPFSYAGAARRFYRR
jgi:hypothetical protein